jgi:outer membrane biogenesis lipoprotein LolB
LPQKIKHERQGNMGNVIVLMCAIALLLAGCSPASSPQSKDKPQGRHETKGLEGASAAGYDGKAIRKSVDTTLNKNDERNQELEQGLKAGGGEQKQ